MPSRSRRRPAFVRRACVAYRATSYDVPLWVNPNRRDGRWNIAGRRPTQYTSLDTESPFAEILRHEDLRTDEQASHYSATIWQLRVDDGLLVDYSTFELADAAGFEAEALVGDDHERCQAEAEWLVGEGARGLLSPSAALPGTINLTLFGARVAVPWSTTAELASSVPAQRLTTGHPPPGLAARVRYFGQPERRLQTYLRARRGSG